MAIDRIEDELRFTSFFFKRKLKCVSFRKNYTQHVYTPRRNVRANEKKTLHILSISLSTFLESETYNSWVLFENQNYELVRIKK